MTQRSQDRQHTGKRGAVQRKARRAGYKSPFAKIFSAQGAWLRFSASSSHRLRAAYIHGARDWREKHKEVADAVA